ncbi:MAG: sigma-70 family RNA polymerase sigma factor [Erysipelotrichaceae bacterium]|nr:sigma-70 family RNA polymerase sigma factor [Erysipelotrichaceae bacterium]
MEDREIIELYWKRNEDAIRQSDNKYGRYCLSIADRILHDMADSEECVSDTWLRSWYAMPPQRPAVLKLFFATIVRNLAFKRYEASHAQKRGGSNVETALEELEGVIGSADNVRQDFELDQLTHCICEFLDTISRKDRVLFLKRYFYALEIPEIAEETGLSAHAVSVSLSRTRSRLKTWLQKEGWL